MTTEEFNTIAPYLRDDTYEKVSFIVTLNACDKDCFDIMTPKTIVQAKDLEDFKRKVKKNIATSEYRGCDICILDIEFVPLCR